jgi:hypothetical protein
LHDLVGREPERRATWPGRVRIAGYSGGVVHHQFDLSVRQMPPGPGSLRLAREPGVGSIDHGQEQGLFLF